MPIIAWETCHIDGFDRLMKLSMMHWFATYSRSQPSQRHNPGNPPRSAKTKRHKRETQKARVTF